MGKGRMASDEKDRYEIRGTRYERDAEDFYERGICHIRMFSFVPTCKYELTLIVGKSRLATLGSANSFGIRVCALTNYGQVRKNFP